MNLQAIRKRVEALEKAAGRKTFSLPETIISFIETATGEDGMIRPGPIVSRVRMLAGGGLQWIDPDGNPIAAPAS